MKKKDKMLKKPAVEKSKKQVQHMLIKYIESKEMCRLQQQFNQRRASGSLKPTFKTKKKNI